MYGVYAVSVSELFVRLNYYSDYFISLSLSQYASVYIYCERENNNGFCHFGMEIYIQCAVGHKNPTPGHYHRIIHFFQSSGSVEAYAAEAQRQKCNKNSGFSERASLDT